MRCEFCGFGNGDDEHRCLRCGRRTTSRVIAAASSGNNALALDPWLLEQARLNETQELPLLQGQSPSFGNVIPFTEIQRQAGRTPSPATPPPAPTFAAPPVRPVPQQRKRAAAVNSAQETLDFTPVAASPPKVLTSGIPASNYCPRAVATLYHRSFAGFVDTAMILCGFALFFGTAQITGSALGESDILGAGRPMLVTLGVFLFLITSFYSVVWLMARRETAGMRIAGLELITFDNSPLDRPTRIVRMATTWLSVGAGGLGIIWALADEENLTWQDHISKSFPAFREADAPFVRQQR